MQKKRPAAVKSRSATKIARVKSSRAAAKKPAGKRGAKSGAGARPAAAATDVLVVNMIPKSLSGEENQDSEPMIAVNPANADHIVGTAFTPDPFGSGLAPYFASTDGGATWRLNAVVPGGNQTADITVALSGAGEKLYAGILRLDSPTQDTRLSVVRGDDFTAPTPMTVLEDRQQPDQPFIQAATVGAGQSDAGKENFYVGNNDFAGSPQTATIDVGLDAGSAAPAIASVRVERRVTGGQNGPQVRPSVHPDGTVYAAFYGWRSQSGDWPSNTLRVTADAVVVRDDNWGRGPQPFEALKDPADGVVGCRAGQNLGFAFNQTGLPENGQQRLGGALSIAVDPRPTMSSTVYLAWGADDANSNFALDVRVSRDRGVTWSPSSLLPLPRATNAALAVNANGAVGMLYQQLVGTDASMRWETHFRRSSDTTTWSDVVLASAPAGGPDKQFDPYLGDYCHVLAVGADFYGVFSSANTPDPANFPNSVTYQRNADFTTRKLLAVDGTTQVHASIDPFFFKVAGGAGAASRPSAKRGTVLPQPRRRGRRRPQ